jgi:hypothetical protein
MRTALRLALLPLLMGCLPAAEDAPVARQIVAPPTLMEDSAAAPEGAAPGACFARDRTPLRIETITEPLPVLDALLVGDGSVQTPDAWRNRTRQSIAGGGEELLIETPCRAQMTAELVASLQRALAARGLYGGAVSGALDGETRAALRRFQQKKGLDSAILAIATARELGLVVYQRAPG